MADNLELGVTTMFRDAVRQTTTLELRTGADWSAFNAIRDGANAREDAAKRRFEEDRPGLIAKVTEDLLRDAGSVTYEHPTPFGTGTDKFDKSKIATRAEKLVDQAHKNEMLKLREQEAEDCADLRASIQEREQRHDQVRGHARDAFTRATDRRSGIERRGPSRE